MNERQKRAACLLGEAEQLEWRLARAVWWLDDRHLRHPQRDQLQSVLARASARYDRRERALLEALREGAAA